MGRQVGIEWAGRWVITSAATLSARNNLGIREKTDFKPRPLGQACTRTIHQVSSAFRKRLEQQEPRLSSDHCCPKPESAFLGGYLEPQTSCGLGDPWSVSRDG